MQAEIIALRHQLIVSNENTVAVQILAFAVSC
jgi:hypothetical protein